MLDAKQLLGLIKIEEPSAWKELKFRYHVLIRNAIRLLNLLTILDVQTLCVFEVAGGYRGHPGEDWKGLSGGKGTTPVL